MKYLITVNNNDFITSIGSYYDDLEIKDNDYIVNIDYVDFDKLKLYKYNKNTNTIYLDNEKLFNENFKNIKEKKMNYLFYYKNLNINNFKLPIKIKINENIITFYQKIRDIDRNNINLTINNLRNNDITVYKNWSYKIENNDGYIDLTLDDLLDIQLKVENKYNQILKIHSYLKNKINKLEYEELKTFDCKNEFDNLMNKNLSYIDNLLRNEGNNE